MNSNSIAGIMFLTGLSLWAYMWWRRCRNTRAARGLHARDNFSNINWINRSLTRIGEIIWKPPGPRRNSHLRVGIHPSEAEDAEGKLRWKDTPVNGVAAPLRSPIFGSVLILAELFLFVTYLGWYFLRSSEASILPPVLIGIGLFPFLTRMTKIGLRLRQASALETLDCDKRAPVLYLRSFDHDNVSTGLFSTEESCLASALNRIGPVVAIGRPGELLPPVGAARLYVDARKWQEVATELIQKAGLVVLRSGTTRGVEWELKRAIRELDPAKLLLFVPSPQKLEDYSQFSLFVREHAGVDLPSHLANQVLVGFDKEWRARLFPVDLGPQYYFPPDRRRLERDAGIEAMIREHLSSSANRRDAPSLLDLLQTLEIPLIRPAPYRWSRKTMVFGGICLLTMLPTIGVINPFQVSSRLLAGVLEVILLGAWIFASSYWQYLQAPEDSSYERSCRQILGGFAAVHLLLLAAIIWVVVK